LKIKLIISLIVVIYLASFGTACKSDNKTTKDTGSVIPSTTTTVADRRIIQVPPITVHYAEIMAQYHLQLTGDFSAQEVEELFAILTKIDLSEFSSPLKGYYGQVEANWQKSYDGNNAIFTMWSSSDSGITSSYGTTIIIEHRADGTWYLQNYINWIS
jgi:hypothetical protein